MAWYDEFTDMKSAGERTAKAFQAPVGLASPLWFAFGAAASVGVAYWWMTRWAKPVNVEALTEIVAAPALVALAPVIEPEAPAAEPVIAPIAAETVAEPVTKAEPVAEAAPVKAAPAKAPKVKAPPPAPDDLTVMNGIGPKLAEHLAARGVTRFAHIAKWTEEDLAEIDKALSLKGRAVREAWVAQAKRFAKAR